MALEESVNEDNWVSTRKGARPETIVSASSFEVVTITFSVAYEELKYYGLTKTAADAYIAANPTLDLEREDISNFPTACNLIKRVETRTVASVTGSARPT